VTSASGNVSEENIKKWFNDIHAYLSDEKLVDILNDPERIFNGDETGFSLCPKTKFVGRSDTGWMKAEVFMNI